MFYILTIFWTILSRDNFVRFVERQLNFQFHWKKQFTDFLYEQD